LYLYQRLSGTEDVLPEQVAAWRYVEETARRIAIAHGYQEMRTPTMEQTRLFLRGVGVGTDIVDKEMYSFTMSGENGQADQITLRSEGTAPLMRAYIQNGMSSRPQPVKIFAFPSVFRHDRPQEGRLREHHQFDVEAFGEADPLVDAEIITLLMRFYEALGLRELTIQLNSIGDAACRPQHVAALRAYYEPRLGEVCEDCRRRFHTNPLRLLDCKKPTCQPIAANAPRIDLMLCAACADHFARLQRYLRDVGLDFTLNPRLVRGLDYYTRTVFEVWPPTVGAQASIGGGGRYDGLAELLDGPPTPGVGFGTGIERIILNLEKQGVPIPSLPRPGVYLIPLGEEARVRLHVLADELRRAGVGAYLGFGGRSVKALLRQANTYGCRWAVIVGESELAEEQATLRDLEAKSEERVPLNSVVARLTHEGMFTR